jgi:hypothetical protein
MASPTLVVPNRDRRAWRTFRRSAESVAVFGVLCALGLMMALPFLWTITSALKVPGT